MKTLIEILKEHAKIYPLMEPCDAVKLIYQNEFGGGHLIKDAAQSLERLRAEYSETLRDQSVSLYEDIGNGVVRVNLAAIDVGTYPLECLNSDFVRSSELHTGDKESFIMKLRELRDRFDECGFSFTLDDLEGYLIKYANAGYPMVSHSEAYRKEYRPAYRVIVKDQIQKPEV